MKSAAFTLLELIIVISVLAILAIYIQSRPSSSNSYQQDTVIEKIISAGRLTQQLQMNDSTRNFSLSIQTNQIELLQNFVNPPSADVSISPGSVSFPLSFGTKISLSPPSTIIFDRLGGKATASTIIVAIDGEPNKSVCFETSGYIRRC